MRSLLCSMLMIVGAVSLVAQEPPSRDSRAVAAMANQVLSQLERVEAETTVRSAIVMRDAFIMAQLAAASGELNDFQKGVAIQKAIDRVREASRRAAEKPMAPPELTRLLGKATAELEKAKDQGLSSDYTALVRNLAEISQDVQVLAFRDLRDLQKIRLGLGDIQARVNRMTEDIDKATGELLASTLDLARGSK